MNDNTLIAEFMGIELDTESYRCGSKMTYEDWLNHSTQKNMRFHESWDWLMPVIEKCLVGEAEQSDEISNATIKNIYEGICNQDISHAYKSVITFIKECNDE